MDLAPLNSFDAVVVTLALLAALMGFMTGVLRALATIAGYVAAAPITFVAATLVMTAMAGSSPAPAMQTGAIMAATFVASGIVVGALLRTLLDALFGRHVTMSDRLAGSLLGAARIGALAVLAIVVVDRVVPATLQPSFLTDSRLRPLLSAAGQQGMRALPPEIDVAIDRITRQSGL